MIFVCSFQIVVVLCSLVVCHKECNVCKYWAEKHRHFTDKWTNFAMMRTTDKNKVERLFGDFKVIAHERRTLEGNLTKDSLHAFNRYSSTDEADNEEMAECPSIDSDEVEDLFKKCKDVVTERTDEEKRLADQGKVIRQNVKRADISQLRQKNRDPMNRLRELKQLPFECVTTKLVDKYNLTSDMVDTCLSRIAVDGKFGNISKDYCLRNVFSGECDANSEYRTIDGTCNNLMNPRWGSSDNCFRRLLPPNYEGDYGFRQSVEGGPLPEPRNISLNIHSHLNRTTDIITHMFMFFGQLLDHDISQAPLSTTVDNQPIECCNVEEPLHPQCAPISIASDDPFYSQHNTTCLNFVRSAICPRCTLGAREISTQITAFIDASFIYGNNQNSTENLRTDNETGKMRVVSSEFGDLLPAVPNPEDDQQCSMVNSSDICFQTGDQRANQHSVLTSLHTIFLREHNRLAKGLREMNPSWESDKIFQEARKIVGAEMQVITYNEYLPITLGSDLMSFYNLSITDEGWTDYDNETDPSLYSEFSTAAFRFGHTLINENVANSPRNGSNFGRLLRNDFFQPFDLRRGSISPLILGATESPAQKYDRHVVPDCTNYLHRSRSQDTGLDLVAFDIQRGRDHGLPNYVDTVLYCSDGDTRIDDFSDLTSTMSEENKNLLEENYRNVNDIDLWTGILSEPRIDDGWVGSTGACIIGITFNELKFGDRFYFEHRDQVGSFSYQQVEELKNVTLSRIICLNTDIQELPQNAMLFNTTDNPYISCDSVSGVDLSYWRE